MCLAASSGLVGSAAAAQTAASDIVAVNVVQGWASGNGHDVAAIHIRLAPGWKTYWRLPGDSGIPPVFDWSASSNVASVGISWPHPEVYEDDGVRTIGYKSEVYLPLDLVARNPASPMRLSGRAALGVCREICMPVEVAFSSDITPGAAPGPAAPAIRAALASVPRAGLAAATASCEVSPIRDGLRLTARIKVAPQGSPEFVFLEPDRDDLWISPAETHREGGTLTASAELVAPDAQPFALNRSALAFTVLGRDGSVAFRGCTPGPG